MEIWTASQTVADVRSNAAIPSDRSGTTVNRNTDLTTHTDDILILGTGLAGLITAQSLAHAGLKVTLVGPDFQNPDRPVDGRTTALMLGSVGWLEEIGLWASCRKFAEPLRILRIIDDTDYLIRAPELTFRASEIDQESFGYNVANSLLVEACGKQIMASPLIHVLTTDAVTRIRPSENGIRLFTREGDEIKGRLLIGADGRNSLSRQVAGIETRSWRYDQTALVCNFQHTRDHDNISTEFHRPPGPLTTVPLPGQNSSLVWVEKPQKAAELKQRTDPDFISELEERLHGMLGSIVHVGRRATFPLAGMHADTFARNRILLVGEAAHLIPPIGAQGLNLAIRDCAALTKILRDVQSSDAEIAKEPDRENEPDYPKDPGHPHRLEAYNQARKADIRSRSAAVDLMNRSLISGFVPLQAFRSLGLHLIKGFGPIKKFFMEQGLGATSLNPAQNPLPHNSKSNASLSDAANSGKTRDPLGWT